jgi:RNA polymerase sigma-70 factor, ECF subfamily
VPKSASALREEHERLLREHYVPVFRFLRNMARRSDDAADLTQQTFVRAITAWSRYDERLPLLSWLYAIAFREFCKWRRARLWVPLRPERLAAADPYGQVEDSDVLLNALARLNPAARATFLLHYVEELSIIEISALLEIPEGTVKSRLHQARLRLKSLIQEDESYVPETV